MRKYVVGFMYNDDFLYDHYEAESASHAIQLFKEDMNAADKEGNGWWTWNQSGDRVIEVRIAFIAGIEARPSGGSGRWSG